MEERHSRSNPTAGALASMVIVVLVFCAGIWFGIGVSHKNNDNHADATLSTSSGSIPQTNSRTGPDNHGLTDGVSGAAQNLHLGADSHPGVSIFSHIGPITPDTIADVASKAGHFVVNIEVSYAKSDRAQDSTARPQAIRGSGVILRADGYMITSAHLLNPGGQVKVTLEDRQVMLAKVIGIDKFTDLAVLKIDSQNLPVAVVGDSSKLRPGDWAIAIGSPLGFDHTVTFGIISAIGRSLNDLNNHSEMIQTDAAINVGNSGGPLLNILGEVVGINTAVRLNAQNISFSVPINTARDVAAALIEHGRIARPFLGFYIEDFDGYSARTMNLPATHGVLIRSVISGGPCHKAGLMPLDVIQTVDGKTVETAKQLREIIAAHKPGDVIVFLVQRKSGTESRKVTVGSFQSE